MSFISQITDPEELSALEQDRLRWQWHRLIVEQGKHDDLGEWLKDTAPQVIEEYRSYEAETEPGVYYLGLPSWCWNNHQDICEQFMAEQGIE